MLVELKNIRPGGDVNVRRTDPKSGVAALAQSISEQGLLQPLLVDDAGGVFKVIDGNRRLAALGVLAERGDITPEYSVEVMVRDAAKTTAVEASLAANVMREFLHPVDEFEAFAELAAGGMTADEIALRFGATVKQIEQRMALGALHPDIRDAWRAREIDDRTARAFTVCVDPERQVALFRRLSKERNLNAWAIDRALGVDADSSAALRVIGVDAYRARGGEVTTDLFDDTRYVVSDKELAGRMLAEAVEAKCAELRAEGWSFAFPASEIRDAWKWRAADKPRPKFSAEEKSAVDEANAIIARMDEAGGPEGLEACNEYEAAERRVAEITDAATLRAYSAKQRKAAGCLVSVDVDAASGIHVDYGCVRPQDARQADAAKAPDDRAGAEPGDEPAAPESAALSKAVVLSLSDRVTTATARALAKHPKGAMLALTAALACAYGSPLRIEKNGALSAHTVADSIADEGQTAFAGTLAMIQKMPSEKVLETMSALAAASLNMLRQHGWHGHDEGEAALLGIIPPKAYREEALKVFDPSEYFAAVSAAACKEALEEMGVDRRTWPAKKAELASLAATAALDREWLPAIMRFEVLTGAA